LEPSSELVPGVPDWSWIAINGVQQSQKMRSKMTTLLVRNSINRSPLQHGFVLVSLVLGLNWFALPGAALAQLPSPTPDGGYANANTAEGDGALNSLTNGIDNTASGFEALFSNTTGNFNTANGASALRLNTTGSANTATGFQTL
jgi:hypothetical protein